jgi:hypothetical protein
MAMQWGEILSLILTAAKVLLTVTLVGVGIAEAFRYRKRVLDRRNAQCPPDDAPPHAPPPPDGDEDGSG